MEVSVHNKLASRRRVQSDLDIFARAVLDLGRTGEHIPGDDCPAHPSPQRDVGLVLPEIAAANEYAAGGRLDRRDLSLFAPLNKSAIAESDRSHTIDLCNLIARSPERAVGDAHNPSV